MTPEKLVAQVRESLGSGLTSVVLYGSAAAGDHTGKRSDYNVLVVVDELGRQQLDSLSRTAAAWARAGNPPPLMFTMERLRRSADVFPIELLDIKDNHRVLFGEDVLDHIEVNRENLRLELEHELKGKLIQLRQRYLLTGGRRRRIAALMIDTLSTFLVLFRASLRLYQDEVPRTKLESAEALAEYVAFDCEVFRMVHELKSARRKISRADAGALFERYLTTVEAVVDAVDSHIHGTEASAETGTQE